MKYYLTPGPSQPYPKLKQYLDDAWDQDVISWSHRGQAFIDLYKRVDQHLRELLNVPADYKILFVGSATEAMERIIQGVVTTSSHHIVLGAFGEKWHAIAKQLGKRPTAQTIDVTKPIVTDLLDVPVEAELICLTLSETSSGATIAPPALKRLGKHPKHQLLALDIVSAAPLIPVDWNVTDIAFFSVQKAFGLPAGLGVIIVSDKAIEKSAQLSMDGILTGSYHSLSSLAKEAAKYQTFETPNVLGIYLLDRVVEDMLQSGPATLQHQVKRRASNFYEIIKQHPSIVTYVQDPDWQSPSVIVIDINGSNAQLLEHLKKNNLVAGKGYAAEHKERHLRLANFPAIPDEAFEALTHHIQTWSE